MQNNVNITGAAGGCHGIVVETGTDAITGKFYAIQVLTDTIFALLTENNKSGDAMTGFTLPAGTTIINGLGITAFTLTSGRVRAYKLPT
jgi:hypothetical protein